mgnify:CR=1 FL=1
MKAINNKGKIRVYASVPDSFTSSAGVHMNATKMSDEKLKSIGLFDVIISDDYDERVHTLGEVYFDSPNTVFKKDLIDKIWTETLDKLKVQKINHFKSEVNSELSKTDWYVIRKTDNNDAIPSDVQTARTNLRTQSATVETEINALTEKKEVVLYDFPNI